MSRESGDSNSFALCCRRYRGSKIAFDPKPWADAHGYLLTPHSRLTQFIDRLATKPPLRSYQLDVPGVTSR